MLKFNYRLWPIKKLTAELYIWWVLWTVVIYCHIKITWQCLFSNYLAFIVKMMYFWITSLDLFISSINFWFGLDERFCSANHSFSSDESITFVCLTEYYFHEGVHPRRPFKWDQDSWRWRLLPFTFPSVPQASSLTSCCRASAIHISLRIQWGVSGSRLRVSTLINQSRWEVAWWDFIRSQGRNACFSLLFAWT